MLAAEVYQDQDQELQPFFSLPMELQPEDRVAQLLLELEPSVSWGRRQAAARKLGYLGCQEAVPALVAALPADPFWMVRCAIIQALEILGDPRAIAALIDVAGRDEFQIVRTHAAKAVKRILDDA